MKYLRIYLILFLAFLSITLKAHESLNTISGFVSPESVVQDAKGDIYVSEIGEFNKDGDGKLHVFQLMENFQLLQAAWTILRV